jgi:hypothetical protein
MADFVKHTLIVFDAENNIIIRFMILHQFPYQIKIMQAVEEEKDWLQCQSRYVQFDPISHFAPFKSAG